MTFKPKLKRSRLDRMIAHYQQIPMREAQCLIVAGKVTLDGQVILNRQQLVSYLDKVSVDGRALSTVEPCYLMLNKPAGILSATKDKQFTTVVECIPEELCAYPESLHYAGRLDRASTGLMLLSNDGAWTKVLADADNKIAKHYLVTVEKPLKHSDIEAFAKGFFFETEQQWTSPAQLLIIAPYKAKVVIYEGMYHQIKRMFARVENRVLELHRTQIGEIIMDKALASGQSRPLSPQEILSVFQ